MWFNIRHIVTIGFCILIHTIIYGQTLTSVDAGLDRTICLGKSTTLGGAPLFMFSNVCVSGSQVSPSWTGPNGFSSTDPTPVVSPTSLGDNVYTLTIDGMSDNVTITVVELSKIEYSSSPMTIFKEVDQPYKMIGSYSDMDIEFRAEFNPAGTTISAGFISWGGEASGNTDNTTVSVSIGFFSNKKETEVTLSNCGTIDKKKLYIIDEPNGLGEVAFAGSHPIESAIAYSNNLLEGAATNPSGIWASAEYPGGQHNTIGDAARHACWSCLLSMRCGYAYAIGVTTQHEVSGGGGGYAGTTTMVETVMDIHNNKLGATLGNGCGIFSSNDCCFNLIRSAVSSGQALYLDNPAAATSNDALLQPTNK